MSKTERSHNLAITILLSVIMFIAIIISTAIAVVLTYSIVDTGIFVGRVGNHDAIVKIMMIIALTSILVGAAIAVISSKIIAGPAGRLVAQMDRLASGDFKARLELSKSLEKVYVMSTVADSFNRMASELENTEMLRNDFINNFSHEFKTPIVSVAGFAKLLKHGNLTEQQKAEYLDVIEKESVRLAAMAANVLDLTKVENQKILTNTKEYNLSEQLRSAFLLLENKWVKKHIDFYLDFDEYFIEANEELLKQAWINLIDNAIKFTPDYGIVKIQISEEADSLIVSVTNSGSEIAPENRDRIFIKFYQEDESHSGEGNGIGLAIVKKVVELHRGEVFVNSRDKMTSFTVTLPKKQKF